MKLDKETLLQLGMQIASLVTVVLIAAEVLKELEHVETDRAKLGAVIDSDIRNTGRLDRLERALGVEQPPADAIPVHEVVDEPQDAAPAAEELPKRTSKATGHARTKLAAVPTDKKGTDS